MLLLQPLCLRDGVDVVEPGRELAEVEGVEVDADLGHVVVEPVELAHRGRAQVVDPLLPRGQIKGVPVSEFKPSSIKRF